jgi:hypothetical protein
MKWIVILAVIACAQAAVTNSTGTITFRDAVLAGAGARVFAQTVLHPLEGSNLIHHISLFKRDFYI